MFNWNDLCYLLEAHRRGSMMSAARRLEVDQTTVARHIKNLEQSLNTELIIVNSRGFILTEEGMRLIRHAEMVEQLASTITTDFAGDHNHISGVVRLGVPEGLGLYYLAKILPQLSEAYPSLTVELVTFMNIPNIVNREVDIVIAQERHSAGQVVITKLADYSLKLYASPQYLLGHSTIQNKNDLQKHNFVGYISNMVYTEELQYFNKVCYSPRMAFKSTSIFAQQVAAMHHAGIAILPCYMVPDDGQLQAVLPHEIQLQLTYWAMSRKENLERTRVRLVWDFIKKNMQEQKHFFWQE